MSRQRGTAGLLRAFDAAMKDEGISAETREHVLNRVVYGAPHPGMRQRDRDAAQVQQPITITMIVAPRLNDAMFQAGVEAGLRAMRGYPRR